jgi:hypothetical protein
MGIIDPLADSVRFIRLHSVGEFLERARGAALRPVYDGCQRVIVKLDHETSLAPDPSLRISELPAADLPRIRALVYKPREELEARFERGERCFIASDGPRVVSYFWAQFGTKDFREMRLSVELSRHQTWMYNGITARSARGRSLYPNIIRYMAKTLLAEGVTAAFIDVDPGNQASLRGVEKAGCTPVALLRMRKVGSSLLHEVVVYDRDAWDSLHDAVSGGRIQEAAT